MKFIEWKNPQKCLHFKTKFIRIGFIGKEEIGKEMQCEECGKKWIEISKINKE